MFGGYETRIANVLLGDRERDREIDTKVFCIYQHTIQQVKSLRYYINIPSLCNICSIANGIKNNVKKLLSTNAVPQSACFRRRFNFLRDSVCLTSQGRLFQSIAPLQLNYFCNTLSVVMGREVYSQSPLGYGLILKQITNVDS